MENAWILTVVGALVLGAYSWALVWSRRDSVLRHVALPAWVILAPALALGSISLLGWHRPMDLAWYLSDEYRVLGYKAVADEAIYLYVDDGGEPMALSIPWDGEKASKLQEMMESRGAILRFEKTLDTREPVFHPMPQPIRPMPKGDPPPAPRYEGA